MDNISQIVLLHRKWDTMMRNSEQLALFANCRELNIGAQTPVQLLIAPVFDATQIPLGSLPSSSYDKIK